MKKSKVKFLYPPYIKILAMATVMVFLQSCYSIRVSNVQGVGEPDPMNFDDGYYKGKKVTIIDTTVSLKALENEVLLIETCPEGCFQTVEYRVTLGAALLSGITFGKKRKIKMKYVCLKESN